jgi:hypothetical protein
MQQMSTSNSPAASTGENVPEIQAEIHLLTERVRLLNQSTDWWNDKMVWALIAIAVASVSVVWTTVMALKRSRQMGDAQSELIQAKDRQLALDLRDKDLKIAEALRGAGEAKEKGDIAEQHAAEANLRAEQEKLERIKLEEDLSPRLFNGATEAIKLMSTFRGTSVLLEYSLDLECKATAERIAFVLSEAGWSITPRPNNDPNAVFFEGVVVGYVGQGGVGVNPVPTTIRLPFEDTPPIKNAGEVLLEELNHSGIDAHSTPGIGRVGEAVYVYVGFKPSPESKRELKIDREIERRILDRIGKGKPPDLTDLIEQLKNLRRSGAGGRLQLPAH